MRRHFVRSSRVRLALGAHGLCRRALGAFATLGLVAGMIALTAPAASAATTAAAAIDTGGEHACALTSSGGVKCWGWNYVGQLGDGTTTDRLTPVDVSGLSSGVTAISAGTWYTCALTSSGGVKCWGSNHDGFLGDGTTTDRLTPVDVVDSSSLSGLLSGVTAIAAGYRHTCALTTSGGVKCWGYNPDGQLGDGTTTDSSTPVDVRDPSSLSGLLSGVTAISVGFDHTCALTTSGGVKCWGRNNDGQLGDGTWTNSSTPVDVWGLSSGVTAISAGGGYTCAVMTSGGAKCWGNNVIGQLGNGTWTNSSTPVDVWGLSSGVTAISAGGGHTCAVMTSGGAKCWGNNNYGQLGNGTVPYSSRPVDVLNLPPVRAISAGTRFTCAVTTLDGAKCWGYNSDGELGNGTTTDSSTPVDVWGFEANYLPVASFTASCSGLICDFADTSTDVDGLISSRSWDFGDGSGGSGATVSHTYAAGGTYSAVLTVTDDSGGIGTASRSVTVTPWNLTGSGSKVKGINYAYLNWNRLATSASSVYVYRNGSLVKTTPNIGSYSESPGRGSGSYTYKVCATTSGTRCSNEVKVSF